MKRSKLLNGLITFLCAFILVLMITGGIRLERPGLKLELSQVDAFAWILLLLIGLHRTLYKEWIPENILNRSRQLFSFFEAKPKTTLCTLFLTSVFLHTWLQFNRYNGFHANAYDLSYVAQALWSIGRKVPDLLFLHSTISKGGNYLGEHFAPALAIVGAIFSIFPTMGFLFFIQSLIIGSGIFLTYRLAKAHSLSTKLSVFSALCFILYQPLRASNTWDFREDNLFIPIFFIALILLERANLLGFMLCILLSWTVKENAPLYTAILGIGIALTPQKTLTTRTQRVLGAILFCASLGWFFALNTWITPHFAQGANRTSLVRVLAKFGSSNQEIMSAILRNPIHVLSIILKNFFNLPALRYAILVLLPFLFFMRFSLWFSLLGLAGVAMNLIMDMTTTGFHYECAFIPFLFYVLIRGLKRFAVAESSTHLFLILLSFLLFFGRSPVEAIRRLTPTARQMIVGHELSKIPREASITTQTALHPHLCLRKQAELFTQKPYDTDYVIFDFSPEIDRFSTPNLEAYEQRIDLRKYSKTYAHDGLVIYQLESTNAVKSVH